MKRILVPTETGEDWWIVVHDLCVDDGKFRQLRPIHLLTHLAQFHPKKSKHTFRLCHSLENKLFSVRYNQRELLLALAPVDKPLYTHSRVRDFAAEQAVIAACENYLNSLYTTLEVVSLLNRVFNDGLPSGFRKQSKKFPVFNFEANEWLKIFYDLRSELTHYNSPLPQVRDRRLIVTFATPGSLEHFERDQQYSVDISLVTEFTHRLFDLLDSWARPEILRLNREEKLVVYQELVFDGQLHPKNVTVGDLVDLLPDSDLRTQIVSSKNDVCVATESYGENGESIGQS